MTAPAALRLPLAGLLAEPYGTERRYEIGATIPLPDDLRLVEPLDEGAANLLNRGVLVDATISTAIAGSCARCLRDIELPMTVRIREEALPSVDRRAGAAVDLNTEPDATVSPTTTSWTSRPRPQTRSPSRSRSSPSARRRARGLCVECGQRLGPRRTEHAVDDVDPRLAALRGFKVDGEGEGR